MKQIWVDADAIPNVIKEIHFRAANREKVLTTLIANQWIKVPPSRYLRSMQVLQGFDVADNNSVECVSAGDLAITADGPLASGEREKGGVGLNRRGWFC